MRRLGSTKYKEQKGSSEGRRGEGQKSAKKAGGGLMHKMGTVEKEERGDGGAQCRTGAWVYRFGDCDQVGAVGSIEFKRDKLRSQNVLFDLSGFSHEIRG